MIDRSRALPESWTWTTVGEIADKIDYGYTASADPTAKGPKFLRITDIQDGRVDWSAVPSCEINIEKERQYLLEDGDVVFARTGATTGKSFLIRHPERTIFASYLIRVRPGGGVIPSFLAFYFQSSEYWQRIETEKRGIGQPNVNGSILATLRLPIAPLAEQRRIVAEIETQFTRLDAAVAALERARANLKRYRAAVLSAACDGRLVGIDPGNWQHARIDDLSPPGRKVAYGVLQPGEDTREGVALIRVGDISDGRVKSFDLKRIDPKIAARYPRTRLMGGEVLISLVGAIGRTAVVPEILADANTARAVGVIPVKPGISPFWVELWLRNPACVARMNALSHEVARKTLNLEDVKAATILLPPMEVQTVIVEEAERRLSSQLRLEENIEAELTRAARLRQSILRDAFTGRLVPQDPSDEPASELLDRIRDEREGKQAAPARRGRKAAQARLDL